MVPEVSYALPSSRAGAFFSETHQNKKPPPVRRITQAGAKHVLLPALPARVTRNQFLTRGIGL